ncbi:hypothetical protein WJX79_001614 [Trebouxia sp. C0005]
MDEWVSGDTFSDDPMEAPTQPAMQAEPAADAAEVRKVSKLPLPARKVPARPLPGELAVLDSISTLHFRKVAVSARTTSLPKIHPDIVGLGDHLTPESLLAGGFLQGSKPHTTPHLQVSGVQSLLVGQSMLNGSGSEHLSLLTGGSTIPAWSTNRPTAAVLHSFNKYSKLEAKKPDSFGALPTDSAFDAARLEFKLVDQTVLKAASSDLTRPFNDACLMCQDAHMIDICSGGGGGGGGSCSCKRCGWYCLGCMTCGATSCCLDQNCKCRNFKLGAIRRLELSAQDAEGKELFHLQRGFAIPVQLCYPCAHLACNPLKIVVSAPSGAVLGHVRTSGRAYSSSGWLDVFDADNRLVYSVQEKLWMWPFSSTVFPCLPNILKPQKMLRILTPGGEQVGDIVHLYPGWQKAFYTAESDWMIRFPAGAESVHKALLIGACQLSKFFFFPGHVCGTGLGYFC